MFHKLFFARKQYALVRKPPVSLLCLGDGGLGKLLRILLRSKTQPMALHFHGTFQRSSIQIKHILKYMMLKHHIPVSFKETPMRLRSSGHLESPRWQNLDKRLRVGPMREATRCWHYLYNRTCSPHIYTIKVIPMQNDMPLYLVIDLCLSRSVLSSRLVEQETQTLPQRSNDPAKNRTGPALYHWIKSPWSCNRL